MLKRILTRNIYKINFVTYRFWKIASLVPRGPPVYNYYLSLFHNNVSESLRGHILDNYGDLNLFSKEKQDPISKAYKWRLLNLA